MPARHDHRDKNMNAKPKEKFVTRDDKRFRRDDGTPRGEIVTIYDLAGRMPEPMTRDAAIYYLDTLYLDQVVLDANCSVWVRVV